MKVAVMELCVDQFTKCHHRNKERVVKVVKNDISTFKWTLLVNTENMTPYEGPSRCIWIQDGCCGCCLEDEGAQMEALCRGPVDF